MIFKIGKAAPAPEPGAVAPNDLEHVVGGFAQKASGLGKESADLNGLIDDLAAMSGKQAETFKALAGEIDAMVRANQAIEEVTKASSESVRRARKTVEQLGQGVIAVTGNLADVAEAANEITQIALQTRLVAFNASVEAKRAGEAGRGFGVVAEAVKDLAAKVEESSKQIMSTVTQLEARIKLLADDIQSKESSQNSASKNGTFDAAVSEVERGVDDIAVAAQQNLSGCAGVLDSVRGLSKQVAGTATALQHARKKTEGFLSLSEALIEMAAESGIRTEDSPFIEAALDAARQIIERFEQAVRNGQISMDDLFDENHQLIAGSNPEQYMTRFTQFTDQVLPDILEKTLTWSPKVAFGVAIDRKGYIPTHNRKYSKQPGADPVWNQANCRNRRFFNGRTEKAAVESKSRFLLQTYRRDMGGGNHVVMKDLSVPIDVNGRRWGALRIGYQF
ncbi:MAG: methyl-accepting chemotaxis protein [Noviherbaspirillum sp.]